MTEETNTLLKKILEELKAIRKEVAPTRMKKVTHTANIAGETIIKFKNGEKLYMPFEMYEELEFKRDGSVECSWTEDGHDYKARFSWEDALYIARTTRNTSQKDD